MRLSKQLGTRGFTLIELMVTVSVIAIISAFAAPSMSEFFAKWQISDTLNTYSSSLQLARSEAVKRGRTVRMCRSSNGTSCTTTSEGLKGWQIGWIVYVDNDASGTSVTTGDEILFVQPELKNFDSILSNDASPSSIAYSPFGTLVKGVGAQGLTFNKDNTHKRGLCISFSGRYYFVNDTSDCKS